MGEYQRVRREVKCLHSALERLEGGGDILCLPNFGGCDFEAERAGCCLNFAHFHNGGGITGIGSDRQPAETRNNLTQEFESFTRKIGRLEGKTGDVAPWPRQARNHATANGVQRQREDNWDYGCRLLCRENCASCCNNYIDIKPHKLGRDLGETLGASFRPAKFECNITTFNPAEFAQPLHKSGDKLAPC